MKEANLSLFSLSKKGFITIFSSAVILSSAVSNLVNAQTIDNSKIVFSEDIEWMKSNATLNGENISIDFSKRFSSYLKQGTIQLASSTNKNIVSLSVNELTLNLTVKGFGDSVISVRATDSEGRTVTDQFQLKITQKGDLNGDGIITPTDALQIYQVTSGKLTLNAEQMKLLDINGDGQVTNADASELMANYVGKKPVTTADRNFFVVLNEINDVPIANTDDFTVQEDETLTIDSVSSILINDMDVDGNSLMVKKVSNPTHGSLTINHDGTFTYDPDDNFNGDDKFTYKVNDGKVDSEEQTVDIHVQAVNDVPVANPGTLDLTEDDGPTNGTLSGTDVESSDLTYTLVDQGKKGTVTITDPKTGAYTYTPNANENGKDSFTFKVNDGTADSEVVTVEVTIKAVNDAPVSNKDTYTIQEDGTLTADLDSSILKNDVDEEGDSLTAKLISGPEHGTLSLNADGTFTYVPEANFNGNDQFTYKANDGKLDSEEQTVTIEVQAVNDAPVANPGALELTEDDGPTNGTLSGTDMENSDLTYTLVDHGKKGTVTITDPKTGAYTYTPKANENGKDSFSFKVNDGTADSEVVTVEVTIKAVNDAPVSNKDTYTIQEDGTLTADLDSSILKNDVDEEGDSLTAKLISSPEHGTLSLNADGTFTYVPEANFNGNDQFTYKANDGKLDSEEQTVKIEVQTVNDVPVAKPGTLELTEDDGSTNGTLSGTDVESSELTYILVDHGTKGTVTITDAKTGAYTYTPNANENGKDSFSFKVNDGTADSEVVTVEITIEAVNDAPVISDVAITGKLVINEMVKGSYTYTDVENDSEGSSIFQWYKGKMQDGSDKAAIQDANTKEYTIQEEDEDYYLFFEVIPVASSGEQSNQSNTSKSSEKVQGLKPSMTVHPDPYRADPLAPITETDLKAQFGTFITVNLTNERFKDTISENDFVLNNAPDGMTIISAMLIDDTTAGLLLQYDGLDFDYDINDFSVTAKDTATLKGKAVTSNNLVIYASVDAPSAFISEYLQGSTIDRSAIEIYYPGDGTSNPVSGVELEVHQWDVAKGQKKVWSLPLHPINANMPYIVINSIFYDFFDITNNWYYNDEAFLTMPGLINNAFVLKKDGKVIDTVGNPFVNSPAPILPSGGTLVRKQGILDGLTPYDKNQWTLYPVDSFQYIGHHTP